MFNRIDRHNNNTHDRHSNNDDNSNNDMKYHVNACNNTKVTNNLIGTRPSLPPTNALVGPGMLVIADEQPVLVRGPHIQCPRVTFLTPFMAPRSFRRREIHAKIHQTASKIDKTMENPPKSGRIDVNSEGRTAAEPRFTELRAGSSSPYH